MVHKSSNQGMFLTQLLVSECSPLMHQTWDFGTGWLGLGRQENKAPVVTKNAFVPNVLSGTGLSFLLFPPLFVQSPISPKHPIKCLWPRLAEDTEVKKRSELSRVFFATAPFLAWNYLRGSNTMYHDQHLGNLIKQRSSLLKWTFG